MREKSGNDKLLSVLHDEREFGRYQIYDGKEIAVQILPPYSFNEGECNLQESNLVLVKAWDQ